MSNNSSFVLKRLDGAQFLSPAIETDAIKKLATHMKSYHSSSEMLPEDKPTCITCFDVSGCGKSTTIKEAARLSESIYCHINLINNPFFTSLFKSCEKFADRYKLGPDDLVSYQAAKKHLVERFDSVLLQLFQCIVDKLKNSDPTKPHIHAVDLSMPDYISPKSSMDDIYRMGDHSLHEQYKDLIQTIDKSGKLLVIHMDDCQKFFCEMTNNPGISDGKIKVDDLMCFALRLFSQCVSALPKQNQILWAFSGTRPNLKQEMKVASTFGEPYDVARTLRDFSSDDVLTILCKYFCLETISLPAEKIETLCGPPKLSYWFILCAQSHQLASIADLISKWDDIESEAILKYRDQIKSTILSFGLPVERSKLSMYARNLCVLHTYAYLSNSSGFLDFDELPNHWLPFIEAGFVRAFENATWKLYPPNRFLVKILNEHVRWFNWENVQYLIAAIKTSGCLTTLSGKIFEFLFALELCSPADSSLWKGLAASMDIQPRLNWQPSIAIMDNVDSCTNTNFIYVMQDPDTKSLKTDVVFFAESNSKPVRVLCQLTVQKKNPRLKVDKALEAMMKIRSEAGTTDLRIFLAPKASISTSGVYKDNFLHNNCFFFDQNSFEKMMQLPLYLCDSAKISESLEFLMNFAKDHQDPQTAQNISSYLPGSSLKRVRTADITNMEEFYFELADEVSDEKYVDTIRAIFEKEAIGVNQLQGLSEQILIEMGIAQKGLRLAILAVLEE